MTQRHEHNRGEGLNYENDMSTNQKEKQEMNEAKHTPGPWEIGDENNQYIEIEIGDAVASLYRQDRFGLHMAFSRDEMRANGRLIKAAPELLEALRAVNRIVAAGAQRGFNCHDGDWAQKLFQSQQATFQAIAKATGKESA